MSSERSHLPHSIFRVAFIVAIALLVDGTAVSLSPQHALALASETTSAPVVTGPANAIPAATVTSQTAGSNPVVAESTLSPRNTSVSEGSSRVSYTGKWSFTSYSGYVGGRAKWSSRRGAMATLHFTGTRVTWVGPVGPTRGKANVYVDGHLVKTVSTYASHFAAKRTLFTASWGSQKAHTMTIVVLGTSGHPTVAIDALVVRSLVSATAPSPSPASKPPSTTPSTAPTPAPKPPTSTPGTRSSGPIEITKSNTVIDGVSISGSGLQGIVAAGTSSSPLRNITIRNCVIKGFTFGIEIRHAENVVIENCTVTDADYAGIALYSVVGGRVSYNTVQRIGTNRSNLGGAFANNAYGITLDRNAGGSLSSDPRSASMSIDHNLVEDVPLWMGINTHAGAHLTISNNTVRRTPRAIFIAGDGAGNPPIDVNITGNSLQQPVTKSGGTSDLEGILYSHLQGGSIKGNAVARGYGSPNGYDYGGSSTGVSISGNSSL